MLKRKLIFYRWASIDSGRGRIDMNKVMDRLNVEIHRDNEFTVLDSGDYKTAIIPLRFESDADPIHLRMLSLRDGTSLPAPETWRQLASSGGISTLFPAIAGRRTPSLTVAIGMGRYGPRNEFIDHEIEEAAFDIAEHARDQVDRMIIGGVSARTSRVERINLLNERVHTEVELHAENRVASVPQAFEAFAALEEARIELDSTSVIDDAIRAQASH